MQKLPIRKILSSILFILIITFIFLIFNHIGAEKADTKTLYLLGGLTFLSLFLFSIIFTREYTIKTVYIGDNKKTKKVKKTENEKKITFEDSIKIVEDYKKYNDVNSFSEYLLNNFAHIFNSVQGVVYVRNKNTSKFSSVANYALYGNKESFDVGNGINGQVAEDKKIKVITEIPEGYITVVSGLGSAYPKNLLVIPFVNNNQTVAVLELASFEEFPKHIDEFYKHINNTIAKKINDLTTKNE